MPIEIVAEAGLNHGGKLSVAKRMADTAKDAGADIVKFQTFLPSEIVHSKDKSYDLLCDLALSSRDFVDLAQHCEEIEIEFLSTPGDLISLKFLVEEVGVKRIKIGSDDLTYAPLTRAAANTGLSIILSTGMATVAEINEAILNIGPVELTLLHCVSLYPTPLELVNLNAINTLREFGLPVGYSDHTSGHLPCVVAAAMGATIIEKHFKPPLAYDCVDAAVSITGHDLRMMITQIRTVEKMLGSGVKDPSPEEKANIEIFRKQADGKRKLT